MGLCLFFLTNFPVAIFIEGDMFIPDSRVLDVWILRSKTEIENSIIKICSKSARNVSSLLCHRAKILYSISGKSAHVQLGKNQENRRKNILEVTDWGH